MLSPKMPPNNPFVFNNKAEFQKEENLINEFFLVLHSSTQQSSSPFAEQCIFNAFQAKNTPSSRKIFISSSSDFCKLNLIKIAIEQKFLLLHNKLRHNFFLVLPSKLQTFNFFFQENARYFFTLICCLFVTVALEKIDAFKLHLFGHRSIRTWNDLI